MVKPTHTSYVFWSPLDTICHVFPEQVPSHTALLIDKVLDMMGDNEGEHYLPPGVHFKDKSGDFAFRDAVRAYL